MERQESGHQQIADDGAPHKTPGKLLKNKRLLLAVSGGGVALLAITVLIFALHRTSTPSQANKICGYDTGYTCQTGDVMTNMSFKCMPEEANQWYRTDQSLVIDPASPDTMYISVEWKGVYKTTDGGKTWLYKSKGIRAYANKDDTSKPCHSEYPVIRIDPFDHNHLVIAISGGGGGILDATTPNSQTGGVYQTFDGGEHWQLMINNHMNRYVNDIAIDPVQKGTVYYTTSSIPASWAGADQSKLYVTKGLVYKTTDYGKTWQELPTGIGSNTNARYALINPANHDEIIVPTWSAKRLSKDGTGTGVSSGKDATVPQLGALRTLDGGKTWQQAFSSFTDVPFLYTYIAPNNFGHLYTVTTNKQNEAPYGLVTTDGKTLSKTKYVDLVAYDPFDASGMHMMGFTTVIIGPDSENFTLWESNDGGYNWHRYGSLPAEYDNFNTSPNRPSRLTWHPTDHNIMFMTGGSGYVWKSTDMGKTWTAILNYKQLAPTSVPNN
ncbi:MAG TPA: hypothetical protein VLI54_06460 [Bacillota bacterium]|nr:hypothetical protein [Bacillota bacterium]